MLDAVTYAGSFIAGVGAIGIGLLKMYSAIITRIRRMELKVRILCIILAKQSNEDKELLLALANGHDDNALEKLLSTL